MNLFVILSALVLVASASRLPRQSTDSDGSNNGVNIASSLLGQLTQVTRQVDGVQAVLSDLTGQLTRMITSGTRLVTGLQAENLNATNAGVPNLGGVDNGLAGGVISTVSSVAGQLANVQRALNEIGVGLGRIVQATTRLIGGGFGSPLH